MGKKDKQTFGQALIKDHRARNRRRRTGNNNTALHVTEPNDGYDWAKKLQSVTSETAMQEIFSLAQLTGQTFTAEKLNAKYIPRNVFKTTIPQPDYREPLSIPRRPKWKFGITQEEQETKEKESFVDWRRFLSDLIENKGACVTPYERNLELWKQLWRTLEKSDIVLILLDARNPLLFRCADLEKYAAEENCKIILLLNKADLTTEYSRKCWAEYFSKENTSIIFFTAAKPKKERRISEESNEAKANVDSDTEESEDDDESPIKENDNELNEIERQLEDLAPEINTNTNRIDAIQETLDNVLENLKLGKPMEPIQEHVNENFGRVKNTHELYTGDQILNLLRKKKIDKLKDPTMLTVGMIGYPNVGKSSTVNILNKTKKASVSAMPGHTRRLQTLILDNNIKLLDCPGLVMPAYAVAPDLLLTGVLPIDEMKSHDEPVARLCELVPRNVFVRKYGLLLPEYNDSKSDYEIILKAHAFNRGFMSAAGQPDVSRSARIFLKEAASGQLKWEVLPPGCDPAPVDTSLEEKKQSKRLPTPREIRAVGGWVEEDFYAKKSIGAHVKGKPILGVSAPDQPIVGKPWKHEKKHANKNKREKLRRVYAHLDQH